ncbi:hypothetical protein ACNOYE_09880 [Nannocystaceae bacterium ST9]
MSILIVDNQDPVELEGYLDGSGGLQFEHGSDPLPDYEQTIEARDDDGLIRVKLLDFSGGGSSWTLSASHDDGGTVTWTRSGTYAYCDFRENKSTPLEVSVVATNGATPPQQKSRVIKVKPRPNV